MDCGRMSERRNAKRLLVDGVTFLFIALALSSCCHSAMAQQDCSAAGHRSPFLRSLIRHREDKCTAEFLALQAQGKTSGYGCGVMAQKRCCSSSGCPAGHACGCASLCGTRTCHLDPTIALGRHCSHLLPPAYGQLVVTGHPGKVRVVCNAGYRLSGASELHCDVTSRKWSHSVPICREVLCEVPRLPPNAHFKQGEDLRRSYARGETVRVVCDPGFSMTGKKNQTRKSRKIKCKRNRKWQNLKKVVCKAPSVTTTPPPACCTIPPAPQHGGRQVLRNTFCAGESVEFYCKECHRLVGPATHTCHGPGNYTAPSTRCEAITCPQPNLPSGFAIISGRSSGYTCGSEVTVTCAEGSETPHTQQPRETIFCNSTGSWRGLGSLRSYMCRRPASPQGVEMVARTTTSITLQWRAPPMHPLEVSWYRVEYWQAGNSGHQRLDRVSPSHNGATRNVIENLSPNTQYHFGVQAVYKSIFTSQRSAWKSVDTIATEVLVPRNVQVRADYSSKTQLPGTRVAWDAPSIGASAVTSYVVRCSTSAPVVGPYRAHDGQTVVPLAGHVLLDHLQPFTQYTVSVVAITRYGRSQEVEFPFTLKAAGLRPRTPPTPSVRTNGTHLFGVMRASTDVFPFVWRYSVRATCDENDSVNGLEDDEQTGAVQCPNADAIVLFKPLATEADSSPERELSFTVDLRKDIRLLPGRQYRVQTQARTKTRVTSSWSSGAFFTVTPSLPKATNNAAG